MGNIQLQVTTGAESRGKMSLAVVQWYCHSKEGRKQPGPILVEESSFLDIDKGQAVFSILLRNAF